MDTLRKINVWLGAIEYAILQFAVVALVLIMGIVSIDVAMRYIFNRPFAWSYDFVSIYLMAFLFFLALARTYAVNGHVSVDLLHHFVGNTARRVLYLVITLVSAMLFSLITYASATRAISQYVENDIVTGDYAWPLWIAGAIVPIGCGLLVLRLCFDALCHLMTLMTGAEIIPLPPTAGSDPIADRASFE
jgi:TRAP-type C4-dicarboxylate transport system permease small subunit